MPKNKRLKQARKHVAEGRQVLSRQRAVIERLKRYGLDTEHSEQILTAFERSQKIFEADLDRIRQENKYNASLHRFAR